MDRGRTCFDGFDHLWSARHAAEVACRDHVDRSRIRADDGHTPKEMGIVVVLAVVDDLLESARCIDVGSLRISIVEGESSGNAVCCAARRCRDIRAFSSPFEETSSSANSVENVEEIWHWTYYRQLGHNPEIGIMPV
jgi:hypothetical protein